MTITYDRIGTGYNLTRKADKYLTDRLLKLLDPKENGLYLDIGCGTGNYTSQFQKRGYQFIGIDPSKKMLDSAKNKNDKVKWSIGTAEKTELPAEKVNGIIGTLTIHHWGDLSKGFSEMFKVLKRKGNIVIFTSTPEQMKGYWLNHYFPRMLMDSIVQMPSLDLVMDAMKMSGFTSIKTEKYFIHPELEDKFLYCGKENPELYFDEQIRHGISSFSSLANQEEVSLGLSKLRADIDSGKITEVMSSYDNQLGDYLFIVGNKPLL
ncbi:MAG: class I SAM-dependent methyltransferase [Flavobacteriales bacterium]|nr:class I SAM-dependent methyltransferase [Flavobacteriales bacterium]